MKLHFSSETILQDEAHLPFLCKRGSWAVSPMSKPVQIIYMNVHVFKHIIGWYSQRNGSQNEKSPKLPHPEAFPFPISCL